MIIDSVRILNFKSLKECLFSFKDIDVNGINAGVLVGLNESGKSSFLEAISLVNKGFDDVDYEEYCYLDEQEEDEYLEMYITYSVKNINELRKELLKYKRLCKEIINELIIENITNNTYINKEGGSLSAVSFTYKDFDVSKYRFEIRESKNSLGELVKVKNLVSNTSLGKDAIYEEVSRDSLESFLRPYLREILKLKSPEIIIWKPSKEYLINEVIDLREFMVEPDNVSVPLKNIFNIYGKTTTEEIANCIENALKSHSRRDKLVDGMSDAITKYVNKIWKEHKIKIRVSIDGGMCNVMIEDTDKKYSYFNMEQRSDGFKQFFSLILSLSTLNE
ncbi:MAG: AAA family ATPase, partial [Flavobacterium sp.]